MLRGKENKKRKKEQICKVKQRQMKKTYIHRRLTARKRTVGKANKGINVEKYNRFNKLKLKKREKRKKKRKLHRTAKAQCRGRGL